MNRIPNFFFVGTAKSGTTAMDIYLRQHPDIFMAAKEPHFFCDDLDVITDKSLDMDAYIALFRDAGDEKVVGETSVFNMFSKAAAGRIKAFSPDARILIQIRNPIDVIASHHSQLLFVGGETEKDLARALALEDERRRTGYLMPRFRYRDVYLYRDFVRFSEQIARYFDAFGRDRVHVVYYDDFARDTAGEYRKVLEFLEVDPDFRTNFEVVNANKTMRSKVLMDLVVRDPPAWLGAIARALLPLDARNRIKAAVWEANTRTVSREPMDPQVKEQLCRELRPEVERLSALLGRDLSHWVGGQGHPSENRAA